MEDCSIVIMRKDEENMFSKEVGSIYSKEGNLYIEAVFSTLEADKDLVNLTLSTGRDVEEWEFSAIFDYYDMEKLEDLSFVETIIENEDRFNPSWEVHFFLPDNEEILNEYIERILDVHDLELKEVYKEISDKKEEYI
ncbi:MAG: DUF6762 family protein [Filifactoraceae bacterium]